jgi:hypothetical protein
MTEVTIEYCDPFITWFESLATPPNMFIWAEINGALVAGSKTVTVGPVPQTGNIVNDVRTAIVTYLTAATGDAPVGWVYPAGLPSLGWATNGFQYGNILKNRPFVAIGSRFDYTYGTLAIPERTIDVDVLKWFVRFEGEAVDSTETSPAWNDLEAYRAAHGGANPILTVMELNPE